MYSKSVARTSFVRMRLDQGQSVDFYKHERLFFTYCPKKAQAVFKRTWANLAKPEEEWFNWGWRATIKLVAGEANLWDRREFAPYRFDFC